MKNSNTVLSDSCCVMNLTFMIILCTYDNHDCMYFVDEKLKSNEVVSEFPPKGYIVSWLLYFVWKDKWPTVRIYINSCQW